MGNLMHLWSNWQRLVIWALVPLLGVALTTAACGGGETQTAPAAEAPKAKPTITLAEQPTTVQLVENHIAKFIIENAYGYPVEGVETVTAVWQVVHAKGQIDVTLDVWPQYYLDWYKKETAAGNIIDLGQQYEGGPQGFIIPKSVAEQHNIKTIEDMKRPEVVALFKDVEDPTKGAFINCIIGWQCAEINRAKMAGYGLDKYYNLISPGSAGAMDAALAGPAKRKQPVFGYYWAPTALFGAYDWYMLEEPPNTKECWAEVTKGQFDRTYTPKQVCAYSNEPVTKTVHKSFLQKAPDVVELLRKMNMGLDPLNQTLAWVVENDIKDNWERAAVYYFRTFEDRWTTWMPADKVQRVKEALAKAN